MSDPALVQRPNESAMTYRERVEARRIEMAKQSRERRAANAAKDRCINEGKGIHGRGLHGPLAPRLNKAGEIVGYYRKCAPCIETHKGTGPNPGRNKRSRFSRHTKTVLS